MTVLGSRSLRFEVLPGVLVPSVALLIITTIRFGFLRGLAGTALVFASLLAHEAGHLLVAAMTGTRCSAIGLCLWGAYIRRTRAARWVEIAVSAAGPAVNVALAVLLWDAPGIGPFLAQMNAVLAVLNLIPCRGSDGQRILAELRQIVSRQPAPVHAPDSLLPL